MCVDNRGPWEPPPRTYAEPCVDLFNGCGTIQKSSTQSGHTGWLSSGWHRTVSVGSCMSPCENGSATLAIDSVLSHHMPIAWWAQRSQTLPMTSVCYLFLNKMTRSWFQDCPRCPQDVAKMPHHAPKMKPRRPTIAKAAPRWPADGSTMVGQDSTRT